MFAMLQLCMIKGPSGHGERVDVPRRDGGMVRTDSPVPEGIFILSMDITERKRTEETDTLRTPSYNSSRDMVASHDLQEPLRMVTAYLGLLEMKYGDQTGRRCKEVHGLCN